ncbi:hypothetical protein LTR36_005958 [Oleoguttula mirabilis]|uniref:Major facilitator superfamily (MFS) profile domain-containing protein n=1 Tax=Oleoguttula mirabilis TaxID=1507867 RepID=A0AAV9JDT0_9PEZI|nr:hypothetical protein LTR36_005958 [Oleoguttula mirabilis]
MSANEFPITPVSDSSKKSAEAENIEGKLTGSKSNTSSSSRRSRAPGRNTTSTTGRPVTEKDAAVEPLGVLCPVTGKRILTEEAGYEYLGFVWSPRKKWLILTSIFIVQISMNFNAAVYANAVSGMAKEFGISAHQAKLGQMVFLIAYAFGCELWAPWSEELGRKWVLQGSLLLVNLWAIPCALAPNFWVVFAFRLLGGLSSAGGSVTLGMVADMWEPAWQQYAVAYVVLSSVAGSVVAPILGGFIEHYLSWRWVFWIQLLFGVAAQAIHFFTPETRSSCILDKQAKRLRKQGIDIWGPEEVKGPFLQRVNFKQSCKLMWRPYQFLLTEPIVTALSLFSGFSDALIFTGLDSFGLVLRQWNFTTIQVGLSFVPLLVGYLIAWAAFMCRYYFDRKAMDGDENRIRPERRLWLLLWLAPLEAIGLFGFAWTSLGPPQVHWIAPLLFVLPIGIANFAIYMATIDYMVAAYGPYSASATGGNGFCRDFLAGIAALYATPFYHNIAKGTKWQLAIPTWILSGIALAVAIPVYVFYVYGEWFRQRSPFAQGLVQKKEEVKEEREEAKRRTNPQGTPTHSRANSLERVTGGLKRRAGVETVPVTRTHSLVDEGGRRGSVV